LIAYIEYHSFLVLSIAIFTKSVDNLRGKQNAPGRGRGRVFDIAYSLV
jgi:hypothetical protein